MKHIRKQNLRGLRRGFSMVEMLIVISLLALLTVLSTGAFDGARTKAQTMISLGKQIGEANIMLKLDTGCYVKNASALFDPAAAVVASNNYCGRSFGANWARPYMAKYPTDSSGKLRFDKIGAEVVASFAAAPESVLVGGTTWKRYYVRFENVPKDVIRQALNECNANPEAGGDFTKDKCRTQSSLTDEQPGTFDILFDETR